ncbi:MULTISPECIES: flagellar protein FlgN [unclassified Modicisalibacter]|uniref:flagella synthesis protein FlgN n=1 Tax=unclassified Modicisalibacter TaxID=2679913 RepID=UPI001CCB0BEF|nr:MULTISPECIES: flagellar protein FlgN [unclassified Modicisalibacter]MBZ9557002.1 flagellar protein FlgN [Modicisalibacter sp. R2A 31.J]MBZ9574284.1 flagellar protein FlgN [Modicisalibacter sp. MOD 31.J]
MSLAQHLEREHRHLDAFIALLDAEHDALSQVDVDGAHLRQQAADKQAHLERLETLETQRRNVLEKLGYGPGRQAAEQAAIDAGCHEQWTAFLERALHAKLLNQRNGILIESRMAQNQRILYFLNEAAGKTLYGPNGQSRRRGFGGVASQA